MPVNRNAHHTQLPETPFFRTMSVTRLGVSALKVVATMLTPKSHHGMLRPLRKNSAALLPAFRATQRPTARETAKKAAMMAQSRGVSCMAEK